MDQTFKLDDKLHEQIYLKIEARLFQETHSASHPRVIIMGGQPGSGKSKLLESSRELFPDGNVVVINGDELREFHPKSDEIFKLDDKRYAERTDPDSRVWTKRLFDRAIETKRNIIFESTMREVDPIADTLKRLRDQGYHLTAKVVATHERMSTTGIYMRYESQKFDKGYGRFTPQTSHDAGYEGMPQTVEHVEQNKLVDRLEVYNRHGNLLWGNDLKGTDWEKEPTARQIIETERRREPTEKELRELRADWAKIDELMQERKAPLREIKEAKAIRQVIERGLKTRDNPKPPPKLNDFLKIKPKPKDKERGRDDDLTR
jgi:predicted ABC-type ATPase